MGDVIAEESVGCILLFNELIWRKKVGLKAKGMRFEFHMLEYYLRDGEEGLLKRRQRGKYI